MNLKCIKKVKKMKNKVNNTAWYSKSAMVDSRTINYRSSVTTKSDIAYKDIRKVIELHNERQTELEQLGQEPHYLIVRARPRGPRVRTAIRNSQSLGDTLVKDATHFDIYVVRDTRAMHKYEERKVQASSKGLVKTLVSSLKHAAAFGQKTAGVV